MYEYPLVFFFSFFFSFLCDSIKSNIDVIGEYWTDATALSTIYAGCENGVLNPLYAFEEDEVRMSGLWG